MTVPPLRGGPDSARYIALAEGRSVPRPFNVRPLLPTLCGLSPLRWWVVWASSWPVAAAAFILWRHAPGDGMKVAAAGAVLLLALPGILGPSAVIPIGVDLPVTALTLVGCWLFTLHPVAGLAVFLIASTGKETVPVFAALWLWSPIPLVALLVPLVNHRLNKPGPDPLGAQFDHIAKHPIASSIAAHQGRWRDGWLMVAPWGVCLVALYRPTWPLVAVLIVAYGQLLIATDTVRLYQHAAGPVMAYTAAQTIPPAWLPVACVAAVVWWRTPERI